MSRRRASAWRPAGMLALGPRGDTPQGRFPGAVICGCPPPPHTRLFGARGLRSRLHSPGRTSGGKSPRGTTVPGGGACAAAPVRRSGETPTYAPPASWRPEVRTSAPPRHPVTSLGEGDFLNVPQRAQQSWRDVDVGPTLKQCDYRVLPASSLAAPATVPSKQCVQEKIRITKAKEDVRVVMITKSSSKGREKATGEGKAGRKGEHVGLNIR